MVKREKYFGRFGTNKFNLRNLRADVHHGGEELLQVPGGLLLPPGGFCPQFLCFVSKLSKFQCAGGLCSRKGKHRPPQVIDTPVWLYPSPLPFTSFTFISSASDLQSYCDSSVLRSVLVVAHHHFKLFKRFHHYICCSLVLI